MRRFIICVNNASTEQQNILTEYFKNCEDYGYWHWFSDLWLLVDPSDTLTSAILRDKIREMLPTAHQMVFKVEDNADWQGFGNVKMFEWMNETWEG